VIWFYLSFTLSNICQLYVQAFIFLLDIVSGFVLGPRSLPLDGLMQKPLIYVRIEILPPTLL